MKLKVIIGCVLIAATLALATPALALSLGVSPTQVELEVPGGGSITTHVNIHYFSGDVNISLIDIPLRVEPSLIHVDASDDPVTVELTVYGNHSLDTQVYDGYIRFIAVSGGAATGGVQVIAKVTNIADGIAPTEEPASIVEEPAAEVPDEEPPLPVEGQDEEPPLVTTRPAAPVLPSSSSQGFPLILVIGAAAGGILATILVTALVRRWSMWRD